jgi:hypothetical protein
MELSKIARRWNRSSARRLTAAALVVSACSLGALGTATASAATFTTPYYKMTCYTTNSSSNGTATCKGFGKWRVAVSCNFGFTYRSYWVIGSDWSWTSASAGSCLWSVNSVWVEEAPG